MKDVNNVTDGTKLILTGNKVEDFINENINKSDKINNKKLDLEPDEYDNWHNESN